MSEYNMTKRGSEKYLAKGQGMGTSAFEPTFIESLEPALEHIASRGIKLACNAGASDTGLLAEYVRNMIEKRGLKLKVAWIEGDEVSLDLIKKRSKTDKFENLTTDKALDSWEFEPIYAQCYLGSFGIAEAWRQGADIVLCGRVADAAPVIAAGIWWHGWTRTDFNSLAGAFVCGHLIECSNYVTGANWTGFKTFGGRVTNFGFPIAEVNDDGSFVVSKEANTDGCVTIDTCRSQLLYEIQGPWYYNSDVTAELRDIVFQQVDRDRVLVTGVKGMPPPPTTKVGITAMGGYQAEAHYFAVGLDIEEKAQMLETQLCDVLDVDQFHCFKVRTNGRPPLDPRTQDSATCDIRIFAQARREEHLSYEKFLRPIMDNIMAAYPGAQFACDTRQGLPKPYQEYWVALLPQSDVMHRVHMPDGNCIDVPQPEETKTYPRHQPSYETPDPVSLDSFGPTTLAPLGCVAHARSGDKSSNSNVGFYVRNEDEYAWLRSVLTIDKVKDMLGDDYNGKLVERFELRNIWAVHFLLFDHLDRGVASTSTYDCLGKNVAEYLRCKRLQIPQKFLDRGRI